MKIILSSKIRHYVVRVSIFLVTIALIAGMVSCRSQYGLNVASTDGGTVTTPGEGLFSYDEGTVVNLVAVPDAGYKFFNWAGSVDTIADINAAATTITMNSSYHIIARFDCSSCG
jgi:hypothetical protein